MRSDACSAAAFDIPSCSVNVRTDDDSVLLKTPIASRTAALPSCVMNGRVLGSRGQKLLSSLYRDKKSSRTAAYAAGSCRTVFNSLSKFSSVTPNPHANIDGSSGSRSPAIFPDEFLPWVCCHCSWSEKAGITGSEPEFSCSDGSRDGVDRFWGPVRSSGISAGAASFTETVRRGLGGFGVDPEDLASNVVASRSDWPKTSIEVC
mmetsp:Transcript_24613/g.79558  ORF Transcript_24613/g.79558 Transcript_24613/m.79558 type:complete len:205 (-) Transcript_24613:2521-3135(-)